MVGAVLATGGADRRDLGGVPEPGSGCRGGAPAGAALEGFAPEGSGLAVRLPPSCPLTDARVHAGEPSPAGERNHPAPLGPSA